jgi:dihydroorotase-like cyclic amidohydrolase
VLFRPEEEWTFHAAESKSKSRNTSFEGWSLPGRIALTIHEGEIVYDGRIRSASKASHVSKARHGAPAFSYSK